MKIIVDDVKAILVDREDIVAGSVGVYNVEFHLDASWNGYAKTAVFKHGDDCYEVTLNDTNICTLPHQAIKTSGELKIGIRGSFEGKTRPTLWSEDIPIHDGAASGIAVDNLGTETAEYIDLVAGTATTVSSNGVTAVRRSAFAFSTALETVTLPNAKTIGYQAFATCQALKKVDLGSVEDIDDQAFFGCTALETLIIRTPTVCRIGAGLLNGNAGYLTPDRQTYIYVHSDLINAYKAETNVSKYAAQFRAIEDYPEICGLE